MTTLPNIKLRWQRRRREDGLRAIVYYLERGDGLVKVGCTSNYPNRRTALGRRHGTLKLVAWEEGYYELEQVRHQQFAHLRVDPIAEWFRPVEELYDHMLYLLAVHA